MPTKTLPVPEDALVSILKALPEDELMAVFHKALVESDTSPLTAEEKADIEASRKESLSGKTIRWKDLR